MMLQKIKTYILSHKKQSAIIGIFLILGIILISNFVKSRQSAVRYLLSQTQKDSVISYVSASGQMSASNESSIKPKASGDIVLIAVKNGQEMKAGQLIAQIDARDALKTVRDAQANFESAQLAMDKLKQPADKLSILQAENSLAQAQESKTKAQGDLLKSYDDGFNNIANAFLDLPNIMTGLENLYFNSPIQPGFWNIDWYATQVSGDEGEKALQYKSDVYKAYNLARTKYDKNFSDYKISSRASSSSTLEALIIETYETTKAMADAIKATNNYIDYCQDYMERQKKAIPSLVATQQTNLDAYTSKTNSHLLNLLNIKTTIETARQTLINSDRTIAEKTESLDQLKIGADALDIQSQELSLKQKQNALLDAQEKLSDYYIRAPFDGIVSGISIKKGDAVSSGSSVATFTTKQQLAEISLGEADAAKIKTGQKATLTFDAINDLEITGVVSDVDVVGTNSQGVVSYTAKIGLDIQDERIKPGMSVSANIIVDSKMDVLTIPTSALKGMQGSYYVLMSVNKTSQADLENNYGVVIDQTKKQTVEIGAQNDDVVEIVSGLSEGDIVISGQVSTSKTSSSKSSTQSSTNKSQGGVMIPGMGGGEPPR